MIDKLAKFFKPIASLKLTIICLACALVLITVGTLDQVNIGIFEAQNRYFKSFFLYFPLPGTDLKIPWFFGGYTIGGILLINLIAAHVARFKFTWKKAGIVVLHSGLILLLIGQLLTSLFQVESQMRLDQGEARNYSESFYHDELAIIDTSAPDSVEVALGDYYPNSALINPSQLPSPDYPDLKLGPMAVAVPVAKTYKQDERNMPAASVSVFQNGKSVGAWNLAG